jgi:hypothetical protein
MDGVDKTIDYACCFCGGRISRTEIDPCIVSVNTQRTLASKETEGQTFYSHIDCLKKTMQKTTPIYLESLE